ncbi:MAG: bleomycin resistance protein [Alphaproteobacteria bacterium BRH_c36]|nr:MAG: bleomycin resistance protein [Alphaproteobacteria bacterium BRH_c36]
MKGLVPSGILESSLYAEDLDAAEKFYREVLGFEVFSKQSERHVFFVCGGQMLLVFNPKSTAIPPGPEAKIQMSPHGASGPGHLCFRASAEEIAVWKAHLEANDVAIELDFEWPQGGRSVYFRDPAGNSLEFAEPRIWGFR